jgi:hypothetical protein
MQPKENFMKLHALGLAVALSLTGAPMMLTGCDREVSHKEDVKTNSDGSQTKDEKTVKQTPDGNTVTETEKSKTPAPATP